MQRWISTLYLGETTKDPVNAFYERVLRKGSLKKIPFRIKVKRLIFILNNFFNHGEPVVFSWCHLLRLLQFAGDAKLNTMQLRIHPILCQQFTMGARFDKLALL